jgi:hypothetical protein
MTIDGINPKKSNLYRSGNKKPADLDDERTILLYLGLAISSWQYVEEALSQVYIHVRAENNRNTTAATFWSVLSIRKRLNMVNTAIREAIYDETIQLEWRPIYNQVNRQLKLRNKLARFKIVFDASDLDNQQYCLVPTHIESDADISSKHNWEDLFSFNQKFLKLSRRINAFHSSLRVR